jgi:hypothetical protein
LSEHVEGRNHLGCNATKDAHGALGEKIGKDLWGSSMVNPDGELIWNSHGLFPRARVSAARTYYIILYLLLKVVAGE